MFSDCISVLVRWKNLKIKLNRAIKSLRIARSTVRKKQLTFVRLHYVIMYKDLDAQKVLVNSATDLSVY